MGVQVPLLAQRETLNLFAAAHQNILEIRRRNCDKREIAEGIRPAPTCHKARARSTLTHASLTLPSCL